MESQDSNKVLPVENYDYQAKVPDLLTLTGLAGGIAAFYWRDYSRFVNYSGNSLDARAWRIVKSSPKYLIAGYLAGSGLSYLKQMYIKRRLTFMEEYMESHPQDFKTVPNKKFKDVILKWNAVR